MNAAKLQNNAVKDQLKPFLDTSVVRKQRAGHSQHQALLSAVIPTPHYLNNYVRMEFYRGLLLVWIKLYFEAGDSFHRTFSDVVHFYSDRFGREPKVVLSLLALMKSSGFSPDEVPDKEVCRQKLQDLIFSLALEFERAYMDTGDDPTHCARLPSPLKLADAQRREEALLELQRTFDSVEQCRKRCKVDARSTGAVVNTGSRE